MREEEDIALRGTDAGQHPIGAGTDLLDGLALRPRPGPDRPARVVLADLCCQAALESALFFLFTWDGIPCVYYGTEQGFHGGVDPGNREDMFLGNQEAGTPPFDTTNEMFGYVKSLIALRKEREALRRGAVSVVHSGADTGLFAFERSADGDKVLVVVNTRDSQDSAAMSTSFGQGTVLRDLAPGSDGDTFTVGAGGSLEVTVRGRGGLILAP